jgi:cytochrome c
MKNFIFLAACFVTICSCNSSGNKTGGSSDNTKTGASVSSATPKGLEIITSLDCFTCHKVNEKNIGPSYTDVAKKYDATEANIDNLAHKVISGGSGVWGTVPMAAHSSISLDSAKEMVKYILSLRNQQ